MKTQIVRYIDFIFAHSPVRVNCWLPIKVPHFTILYIKISSFTNYYHLLIIIIIIIIIIIYYAHVDSKSRTPMLEPVN